MNKQIENLKKQATEAAQDEFLWELGMRAPSRRQAFNICLTLGLSEEDQKRVTSIPALNRLAPHILQSIACSASLKEKLSMEVVYGPKHYELIAEKKDQQLWDGIAKALNLTQWSQIWDEVPDESIGANDFIPEPAVPLVRRTDGEIQIVIPQFEERLMSHTYSKDNKVVMRIFATSAPLNFYENPVKNYDNYSQCKTPFFFHFAQEKYTANRWRNMVVCVEDRQYRALAEKIARAYETTTARRKKPAKAIVLKNF